MRYSLPLVAGVLLTALAAPALAQDDGLVVYNAQHEELTQEWADGFTKETGIKVTLRNGHEVLAHISGKMRKRFIRLVIGDQVKIEMSPYDADKARIVYRL